MESRKQAGSEPAPDASRREFIRDAAAGLAALAGVGVLAQKAAAAEAGSGDPLTRMQEDLRRAMQKPEAQRRWAMALDLKKCMGCQACTVACRAENKTPAGVNYRPVFKEESGSYPAPKRLHRPRPCMHCEKPACLEACPEHAIKRRADGIVYIDYDACKGAGACVAACPYEVPAIDEGGFFTDGTPAVQAYEKAASFEMGVKRVRETGKAPIGRARKCTYCLHRLNAGMLPACTTTCPGRATFFGDLSDPASLIGELARSSRVTRMNEGAGTKPTTFYLT